MHRQATLITQRLVLRPINLDDLEALWPHVSDPRISRLMSWQAHTDRAQTRAFLAELASSREQGRGLTWTIWAQDTFCGIVSLINIKRTHRALTYDCGELAYWLGLHCRGQGYMAEAGEAVIDHAFEAVNLHRLEVGHFTANPDSERVIKAWGFHYIGEKRHAFMKEGVWHDEQLYDLLLTDLRHWRTS